MLTSFALSLLIMTAGEEGFTQPLADEKSPAEYGHALNKEAALAGWIALFDGDTTFGFRDAKLERDTESKSALLVGGTATSKFHAYTLQCQVVRGGTLHVGDGMKKTLPPGLHRLKFEHSPSALTLADGLAVSRLSLQPTQARPLLNGKDLAGWKAIPYPKAAAGTKVTWEVKDGFVLARGGPGALEYSGLTPNKDVAPPLFENFLLQADVRTAAAHTNGGIFLRNQPGTVMMGYEAQLHNRVYDTRRGQGGCCTGSIDDRQHARKLVCRDGELFRLTTLIMGNHLSTWVNGYQTCDWTDTRPADENPRLGLRLAGGTLQLQAHDPETDLEFHQVLVDDYSARKEMP